VTSGTKITMSSARSVAGPFVEWSGQVGESYRAVVTEGGGTPLEPLSLRVTALVPEPARWFAGLTRRRFISRAHQSIVCSLAHRYSPVQLDDPRDECHPDVSPQKYELSTRVTVVAVCAAAIDWISDPDDWVHGLTNFSVAPSVLIVGVLDGIQRVADRLRADGLKVSAAIAVEEVFSVLERLTPSAIIVDVP
jgi:hypothetical protein